MKVKGEYIKEKTNACFSIIVELMTYLKKYRESIVLVGGWVPLLLYGESESDERTHIGI